MRKSLKILLLLLSSSIVACSTPDEETRLRKALDDLVQAVEQRSVRQVQKFLADDFRTAHHRNSQQLRAFMLLHFRQNKVIKVFTSNIQIALQQEKADMLFNVLVTGSSNWLPERGRRFEVKSRWLKQEGDWKISRVNWQEQTDFH